MHCQRLPNALASCRRYVNDVIDLELDECAPLVSLLGLQIEDHKSWIAPSKKPGFPHFFQFRKAERWSRDNPVYDARVAWQDWDELMWVHKQLFKLAVMEFYAINLPAIPIKAPRFRP